MEQTSVENKQFIQSLHEFKRGWSVVSERFFDEQKQTLNRFIDFAEEYPNIFDRDLEYGHITGSGFVVSTDFSHILMTYHKKLDKWLQLGGHCDNHPIVHEVALTECREESGLEEFEYYPFEKYFKIETKHPFIFDLDCHLIPDYKETPEHFHFDVRYLFTADRELPLTISSESKDLKWIPLDDLLKYNSEESLERPLRKIKFLHAMQ